jgi:hypothetical protein
MRIRNLLAAALISPELVVVLAVYGLFVNYPAVFVFVGAKLLGEAENWKYIAVVPPALVGWSVKAMSDIRNPLDKEHNKLLYSWPHYPLLVARLYLAIALSFAAAVASVGLCLLGKDLQPAVVGAFFVGALAISLTVAAGLTFARDRVREVLLHYG